MTGLIFPDYNLALSRERVSLPKAENRYRKMLLDTKLDYNVFYANKLMEIDRMMEPKILACTKKDLDDLVIHLNNWKRKMKYSSPIKIQRRKKDKCKTHNKIRLNLTKHYVNGEDITLDSILDMIGIRIILCLGGSTESLENIEYCYEVLNEIIDFFMLKKGYNPHIAEPKLSLGFNPQKYPDVIVPEPNHLIKPGYSVFVKDYYAEPKKNAYQSLHIVFTNRLNLPIEVQIRTFATHLRVEYRDALHLEHDIEKYSECDTILLDREKVNIFGYSSFL